MQGRDKGLVKLNGLALIEHVIAAVEPQVDNLLISANRNLDQYRTYGYPVIRDRIEDYAGPLAGILTALETIDTDLLLCVPCDCPWIPADLLQRLQTAMRVQEGEISCVTDGKRLHPVFALLKRSLANDLAAYLDTGERAVYRWFKRRRLVQVDFSRSPKLFLNINTEEALQSLNSDL